jgi:hypothetical protein
MYKGCKIKSALNIGIEFGRSQVNMWLVHDTLVVYHELWHKMGSLEQMGRVPRWNASNLFRQDQQEPLILVFKEPYIKTHYYGTLWDFYTAIKRKQPRLLTKDVNILNNNAHPHVAHTVWDMLCSLQWKVLHHFQYNPDL